MAETPLKSGQRTSSLSNVNGGRSKKAYLSNTRIIPLTRIPIPIARVVNTDHCMQLSITGEPRRALDLAGVRDRAIVMVEDRNKGLSFQSMIKLLPTRAYIPVPKPFQQFYEYGEEVSIVITPLPAVKVGKKIEVVGGEW